MNDKPKELNNSIVIVYRTTNCPKCVILKRQLNKLNIEFEERNIETDTDALADVLQLGKWTMPIMTRNGKLIELKELSDG